MTPPRLTRLKQHWHKLQARERRLISLSALLLGAALLWWLLLQPAWHLWRQAPAQFDQLQNRMARMQALQNQAQALEKLPRLQRQEAFELLQKDSQTLLGDKLELRATGEHIQATLQAVPAEQLAQWLLRIRANARARVSQANLQADHDPENPADALWSGSLNLSLPP